MGMDYPIGISFATRSIGAEGERFEGLADIKMVGNPGRILGSKRFGFGQKQTIG